MILPPFIKRALGSLFGRQAEPEPKPPRPTEFEQQLQSEYDLLRVAGYAAFFVRLYEDRLGFMDMYDRLAGEAVRCSYSITPVERGQDPYAMIDHSNENRMPVVLAIDLLSDTTLNHQLGEHYNPGTIHYASQFQVEPLISLLPREEYLPEKLELITNEQGDIGVVPQPVMPLPQGPQGPMIVLVVDNTNPKGPKPQP